MCLVHCMFCSIELYTSPKGITVTLLWFDEVILKGKITKYLPYVGIAYVGVQYTGSVCTYIPYVTL